MAKEKRRIQEPVPGSEDDSGDNWVQCDRCNKWRRIPASAAEKLADDTPWYCDMNPHQGFNSCAVAQELTNEEIDAGSSGSEDGGDESDGAEESRARLRKLPAVWQLLKDNILGHRKRKVQDEDDIMICHCKPVWAGGDGCGPDCINRMLCIECYPGFCPCEDRCTNQMFTKKQYAKLEVLRAGAKGFGLFATEDIKAGQFIIEYIGEVLEEEEYVRRKDHYMRVGQRHYYFMNIGNGEVIDACRKGNISRFINHSCDPNCETQKWLVKGELAIGLFALKDIAKDEELTFDYNFERYGDKPMRCYCSTKLCRRYIGGAADTVEGFDEAPLLEIDPNDNSASDLPPIMVADNEMDAHVRALLDYRIGVRPDKARETAMLGRLDKLCKVRGIAWPRPSVDATGSSSAAGSSSALPPEQHAVAQARSKASRQSKAQAAKAAVAVAEVKVEGQTGKEEGGAAAVSAAAAAAARQDEAEPGPGSTASALAVPSQPQFRGPLKAAMKQWKHQAMSQQQGSPAGTTPQPSAPTPAATAAKPELTADADQPDDAADAAAPTVPVRKRLRRAAGSRGKARKAKGADKEAEKATVHEEEALADDVPASTTASDMATGARAASSSALLPPHADNAPAPSSSIASAASQPAPGPGVAVGPAASMNTAAARRTTSASQSQLQSFAGPVPFGQARPSVKKRSEIDRRLDSLVGQSGRLKDPNKPNIIKMLRMFNLCDIVANKQLRPEAGDAFRRSPYHNGDAGPSGNGYHGAAGMGSAPASPLLGGEDGPAGLGPYSSASRDRGQMRERDRLEPATVSARQRARMADLSLLLDVMLKTNSTITKKGFIACGLLTQLHQAAGRGLSPSAPKEFAVILRKLLRVVEALPLTADDVYSTRSAHGTFADVLRQLSYSADYDVRTKASILLKKFPVSAVSDPRILAPPAGNGAGPPGHMGRPSPASFGGPPPVHGGLLPPLGETKARLMRPTRTRPEDLDGPPGPDGRPTQQPQAPRTHSAGSLDAMDMDPEVPALHGGQSGLPPRPPRHGPAAARAGGLPLPPGAMAGGAPDDTREGGLDGDGAHESFSKRARRGSFDPSQQGAGDRDRDRDGYPPLPPYYHHDSPHHYGGPPPPGYPYYPPPHHPYPRDHPYGYPPPYGHRFPPYGYDRDRDVDWDRRDRDRDRDRDREEEDRGRGRDRGRDRNRDWDWSHDRLDGLVRDERGSGRGCRSSDGAMQPQHASVPVMGLDGLEEMSADTDMDIDQERLPGPPPKSRRSSKPALLSTEQLMQLHWQTSPHKALATGPSAGAPSAGVRGGNGHVPKRGRAGRGRCNRRALTLAAQQAATRGVGRASRSSVEELLGTEDLFALGIYGGHSWAYGHSWSAGGAADAASCCEEPPYSPLVVHVLDDGLPEDVELGEADRAEGGHETKEELEQAAGLLLPLLAYSPLHESVQEHDQGQQQHQQAGARPVQAALSGPLPVVAGVPAPAPVVLDIRDLRDAAWDDAPDVGHTATATVTIQSEESVLPQHSLRPVRTYAAHAIGGQLQQRRDSPVYLPNAGSAWTSPLSPSVVAAALSGGQHVQQAGTPSTCGLPALAAAHATLGRASSMAPAVGAMGPQGVLASAAGPGAGLSGALPAPLAPVAVHVSSLSDWDEGPVVPPQQPRAQSPLQHAASGLAQPLLAVASPLLDGEDGQMGHYPDTWGEPDVNFEAFVSDTVRHRVGKYTQMDHPARLTQADAKTIFAKVQREVVDKERRAYTERRSQALHKPIERRKLEMNIKEFVRGTVKRWHERTGTLVPAMFL